MKKPAIIAAVFVALCFAVFAFFFFGGQRHLSGFRSPQSEIAPAFTPDPLTQQIIAAGNPYATPSPAEPWLKAELIDPSKGDMPGNVKLRSKAQPVVGAPDGSGTWEIRFKP